MKAKKKISAKQVNDINHAFLIGVHQCPLSYRLRLAIYIIFKR